MEAPDFGGPDDAEAWFAAERGTLLDLLPGSEGAHPAAEGETFAWHRAELSLRLAGFLSGSGMPDRETAAFQGAARTFRAQGDVPGTALVLNELAAVCLRAGALEQARAAAEEAADLARACDDGTALARALCLRGWWLILLRRPEAALGLQMEALTTARRTGHRPTVAEALNAAAVCHSDMGEAGMAVGRLYEALGLFEELDDPVGQTQARGNVACALRRGGRLVEARREAEEALRLARRIRSSRWEGRMVDNLGEIAAAAGEHRQARRLFRTALRTARAVGDVETEVDVLANLGATATALGDPLGALDYLSQALGTMLAADAPGDVTRVLIAQGDAHLELRAAEEAESRYRQALRTARTPSDRERAEAALERLGHRRDMESAPYAHGYQAGRESGLAGGPDPP
ncbi:tetratricopeptide repeat protein [Nocardiopsis chromatogenes]|uniref:tetratricopeptide repeat protein n=1 Tax=Nocardiopsis chromatogenes TaxID=280239 RepID=UPI00178C894E|nr:tetratricopeptide repeat protein [Nocardiopsis chromatogenes]